MTIQIIVGLLLQVLAELIRWIPEWWPTLPPLC